MTFPDTYAAIKDLIAAKLLHTRWARTVVRRSGLRLIGFASGEFVEFLQKLPPGGKPSQVITKLDTPVGASADSDADRRAIGWRSTGASTLTVVRGGGQLRGAGPPSGSVRSLWWHKLRDSTLISGTSNDAKHGYCIDPWETQISAETDGTQSGDWRRRVKQKVGGSGYYTWQLWENTQYTTSFAGEDQPNSISPLYGVAVDAVGGTPGENRNGFYVGEVRVVIYVTRAEYPYRIRLLHEQDGTTNQEQIVFDYSTTVGRRVSSWLSTETLGTGPLAGIPTVRPVRTKLVVDFEGSDTRTTGTREILRSGEGPIGIPFAEVEQKAHWFMDETLEYPDELQPERWRGTEWQRRQDDDIPLIPA